MTISKKDAKLLLILLGIIILVVGYVFVYMPNMNKADQLTSETASLKPELDELNNHFANLSIYYAGIDEAKENSEAELTNYPKDVRYEDLIMFATGLQDKFGIDITALDFAPASLIMTFQTIEEGEGGNDVTVDRNAYSISLIISCDLSYEQMKQVSDFIADSEFRTALDTMNVSYNSTTGALTAVITISKYFVTGPDDEYVPTSVPAVSLGRDDLFGTIHPVEENAGQADNN